MVGSVICFSIMDICVKWLDYYPIGQVLFLRFFIGFIPIFFIWNTVGSGLNEYIKQTDNFSFIGLFLNKEIYLPIILFATVMIISVMIKKKIFDNRN